MQIRVDYLGWTIKREPQNDDVEMTVLQQVIDLLYERCASFFAVFGDPSTWGWMPGRSPYRAAVRNADSSVFIFVHPALPHALIEITGKGCETLSESPHSYVVLEAFQDRLTRLDIACDMLTETRPKDFVDQRSSSRFRSDGHISEESGETWYIGSRKSDRHAAIYRYNPPHERSHLLRCEYRLRAENARIAAASVLESGLEAVAQALGEQFKWAHPDWHVDAPTEIELRAYRPDRKVGKTLYWLTETVAPLLCRLQRDGLIDVRVWFDEFVLSPLDEASATKR